MEQSKKKYTVMQHREYMLSFLEFLVNYRICVSVCTVAYENKGAVQQKINSTLL